MEKVVEPKIDHSAKENNLKAILAMYHHQLNKMKKQLDGLFSNPYTVENLDEIREIAILLQEIQCQLNHPEQELSMDLDYNDIPIQTKNKLNALNKDFNILDNAFLAIDMANQESA
ncbi:hypothetical protein DKG77_15255 [Flagellimonas aquimarina]|uniref:Uncharacterized protein n=1 Tax=Flagellimonas aquimarina TaxID=2201895 RepID=A0A316KV77_9FLAO|nr:hypothetical protein [Allomuricauda koreensis]PWL37654.1 hypothetical protein DKG77_15255 [Allomuricauda koreensis]